MITAQEIVELYKLRVKSQGPVLEQMRAIKQLANGEIIIPLNELDHNAKTSVANLLTLGLDQMSMRVSSTMPTPYFPLCEKDRNEQRTLPVIGSEQSWRCGMQTAWKAKCAVEQGTCLLTPTLQ